MCVVSVSGVFIKVVRGDGFSRGPRCCRGDMSLFGWIIRWCVLAAAAAAARAQDDGWGGASDRGYKLPAGIPLVDGQRFDYIVVGAGAAGAAAAARLALGGRDVLLVEAGGDPGLLSKIPAAALGLLGSSIDWKYDTLSNNVSCLAYRNKQCRFSRGRCLGGTTSMNLMIHTRGTPSDFDDLGIPGWAWDDVRPYFLRFEGLKDLDKLPRSSIPYHNTNGTMRMQFFTDPKNPWHSWMIQGYESLNIPFNPDPNAESIIGATKVIGFVYENERMSSARGYLGREDVKSRLKVATNTRCTGVIIDDDNVARGITVAHGLFRIRLRLYANKEVILCAGALATPQILMLSGIGHADHLNKFNIPVRSDLAVGDDMTDHLLPLVFVKVDGDKNIVKNLLGAKALQLAELILLNKGPLGSNGLTDICTFLNTNCYDFENRRLINDRPECQLPTLQLIHAYVDKGLIWIGTALFQHATNLNDAVTKQLKHLSKDYALILKSPLVLQPFSKGTVRLASRDPLANPAILPNYLSDDRDIEEMLRAITILEHLMETEPYAAANASIVHLDLEGCPAYEDGSRAYWECYCRHLTQTTFHAVGTTALGRVVDERLRVRGVRRLRVADLGVMPRLPRGNTAAAALAIGERLADFILNGD